MKKLTIKYLSNTFFALIIACCISNNMYAQYVNDYKRNADKYYEKGDWYSAAQYYEKYIEQNKKPSSASYEPYTVQGTTASKKNKANNKNNLTQEEIVYRIAECYRKLNDYTNAEKWYAQTVAYNKTNFPYSNLYYGIALRATNKYAEAEKQLNSFIGNYTIKDEFLELAKRELANCTFIQQQLNKKDIALYNVSITNINGVGATYAATTNNNLFVFTSTKIDSANTKNPYKNNLYQAVKSDGVLMNVEKLNIPSSNDVEQGVACFSADGSKLYFTRWIKKAGVNFSSIYVCTKTNNTWDQPVKLAENVNAEGYSTKQPFITMDGKYLLFSSNKPGGVGKFDIWYAPISNNEIGVAKNAGSINTKEDEEAPFYHTATSTLIFASNGYVGMGGFDLYKAEGIIGSNWMAAQNLGYPVNSIKDDNYFISSGKNILQDAYISSDRGTNCCYEIYSVEKQYKKYIQGIVKDCKTQLPLNNALVTLKDAKNNIAVTSNNNGDFLFEMKEFENATVTASKSNYNDGSEKVIASNTDTTKNVVLCLMPIIKDTAVMDTTVTVAPEPTPTELTALFDFAKYDLRNETKVLLDTLASILQREKSLALQIVGYTDAVGNNTYNLNLSKQRANACKSYLIAKGIKANRLTAIAKGECCPILPEIVNGIDNPDARQTNRRVEFKIILIQ